MLKHGLGKKGLRAGHIETEAPQICRRAHTYASYALTSLYAERLPLCCIHTGPRSANEWVSLVMSGRLRERQRSFSPPLNIFGRTTSQC